MKRLIPWIVLVCSVLWVASGWRMPKAAADDFDVPNFGRIPVLVGGRLKPLDTVAINALVIIRGKQTLRTDNRTVSASRWLADVMFNAPAADKYPAFVINNPDVLGMFGWPQTDRKYFSYEEMKPFLKQVDEQGSKAGDIESAKRTQFQTAVFNLRNALILYQRLKNSMQPEGETGFSAKIDAYLKAMPEGLEAMNRRERGEKFDEQKFNSFARLASEFANMADQGYVLAIPPAQPHDGKGEWQSVGASLLRVISDGQVNPIVKACAAMGDAFRSGDTAGFNSRVQEIASWMKQHEPKATGRSGFEHLFNQVAPFYQAMSLYVLAFLLICASWIGCTSALNRSAFYVLLLALTVHSFGLGARMYLQGRPPVTNLYSSAVFIGWGTVIIGLVLERIYRDGIGSACAAAIGFITLIIAHHLAGSGDTLEMLQAVLDTNIWLATHVVCITIGYSAMFLAGMLAVIYVVRGVLTRSLAKDSAQSLVRMTYGVICFATLFSFVGTVLGGIWADQSWGRFWGWDPKENGALLIVLWCAVILHARWGGFIRGRGLMIMALFGNVITAFSWFGVNMLGVGLHSYGFMDKAFPWLVGFTLSQIALMLVAGLPERRWLSFQKAA